MFSEYLLANSPHIDQQLFFTGTVTWQMWRKPQGRSHAWIMCMGAGAGGGGSASAQGGGGGSGAISRLFIPLLSLPDTLYIQVGAGGTGVTGANGNTGAFSFVSLQPNSTVANLYLASGHTVAVGGKANNGGSAAGEVIATVVDCILSSMGNATFIGGVAGVQSGNITALATSIVTGGAGGASTTLAGGNITGAGIFPTIPGGTAGGTTVNGGDGNTGINLWGYGTSGFMSCGGSGGGGTSHAGSHGGAGGNGGLGSGGGGAGNLGAGGANAIGGKGGDGFVGIWSV